LGAVFFMHWYSGRHNTDTPDVDTASEWYASRFEGELGRWLLEVQERGIRCLLGASLREPLEVLDVGGGHAQLTRLFLSAGHRVTVQASSGEALWRLRPLARVEPERLRLLVSRLWELPCADGAYDLVVGVRVLAHVEHWSKLLEEMARVSRRFVLIEYPPLSSANILTPLFFWLKKRVEGNTRPYFCYWDRSLMEQLRSVGFGDFSTYRELAAPMGLHRALGRAKLSRRLEEVLRSAGVTRLLGSPALMLAQRNGEARRSL